MTTDYEERLCDSNNEVHIPEIFCDVAYAGIFAEPVGRIIFAIAQPTVGITLLPMRGSWSVCPNGSTTKRPGSPMGETGRVAATLQKMGISGCGLAAPSSDEGEPAMVTRALLIILYTIARFGEEGNGGAGESWGRWPQGRARLG